MRHPFRAMPIDLEPHILCGGCFATLFPKRNPAVDTRHPQRACCYCNRQTKSGILLTVVDSTGWRCLGEHEVDDDEVFSQARYWRNLREWVSDKYVRK